MTLTEQAVRAEAYALWEQDGRPQGRADEYWFNAERRLAPVVLPRPKRVASATAAKKAPRRRAAAN